MRQLLIISLLIAILSLTAYPSGAAAISQANLDKLLVKLNEISRALSLLQKQVAELIDSSSPAYIRTLDKELIRQKIEQGKEFLFRAEHETEHGFYKKYDALNDDFGNKLHTVYSASIIYTFLYIYDLEKDYNPPSASSRSSLRSERAPERILERLPNWGNFLLSMQNKEEGRKAYGAFYYRYYLDSQEKEKRYPVGTSALSIFTLLRLYDLTGEQKYLESAKSAGDWLTTMQRSDGAMKPYGRYVDGKWYTGKRESLLYGGQVLSALSKLYGATGDKKYYDVAERIAQRFAKKYEEERACPVASQKDCFGGYIQGEYRKKNPISNSWVVMSLLDFYKVNGEDRYKNIIYELSDIILGNQIKNTNDLLNYGRWKGAYSTSGIGWISEVMTEMYRFCREENRKDCDKYKDAVVRAIRWLIQNTYSKENTYLLKNPERAIGGVFWNRSHKYVRTDSVCHALNGYVRIIDYLEDGLLLSLPEKPL